MTKIFFILLTALLFLPSSGAEVLKDKNGRPVPKGGSCGGGVISLPAYRERTREFRGVWVSLAFNLDFPRCKNAAEFRKQYVQLLNRLKALNCNVVLFQLRINCDAAYLSRINPFAASLSGREGRHWGSFDPLPFMVQETHRRGMEFHAWLNPYRVSSSTKLSKAAFLRTLSPQNFAALHPDMVIEYRLADGSRGLLLDPGRPEVREHLNATIREILRKAPVDGICFDDYFYPYAPIGEADYATFRNFNCWKLPLDSWRRENVNQLIRQSSSLCRSYRVKFGVSPFGIWANAREYQGGSPSNGTQSYKDLFANSLLWMKKGYADYMIPQLYWTFDHPKAAYAGMAQWWADCARKSPQCRLYTGHALYRVSPLELANQFRYNQNHPEIQGAALFAARHLKNPKFAAVLRHFWKHSVPAERRWQKER